MIQEQEPQRGQYIQCRFKRECENGSTMETVSWIPVKIKHRDRGGLVKVETGMTIDLKEEDGTWSRDWVITGTGAVLDRAPDVRKAVRNHRKNTGDSTPKVKS